MVNMSPNQIWGLTTNGATSTAKIDHWTSKFTMWISPKMNVANQIGIRGFADHCC